MQLKILMVVGALSGVAIADTPNVAPADAQPVPALPPAVAPDQVTGVEVPDNEAPDHSIARGVLLPFRYATEAVFAPVRGTAYLLDRYQLIDRIKGFLFTEDGDLGVYPTAFIETHLGENVGLHVVENSLFGHDEHVQVGAAYGGSYEQSVDAKVTTGTLLGKLLLGLRGTYQIYDRSDFYGIGNAGLSRPPMAIGSIDALSNDTAVATRFGQHITHGEITAAYPVIPEITLGVVAALNRRTFTEHAEFEGNAFVPTTDVYAHDSLVGYEHGVDNAYFELDATFDTRESASRYISKAAPSWGWWGEAFVGLARGREDDPSSYTRYGLDLRRYINLYKGDRVLFVRGYLEGVTADTDQIPFTDLPRLGGNDLLRGFEIDRFRDRLVAMVSAEYDFPVHYGVNGYFFVDGGRTGHDIGDLDPSDLHYGYGGGLQVQSLSAFLVRGQISHSTEGTFFRLALDPISDLRSKKRRL